MRARSSRSFPHPAARRLIPTRRQPPVSRTRAFDVWRCLLALRVRVTAAARSLSLSFSLALPPLCFPPTTRATTTTTHLITATSVIVKYYTTTRHCRPECIICANARARARDIVIIEREDPECTSHRSTSALVRARVFVCSVPLFLPFSRVLYCVLRNHCRKRALEPTNGPTRVNIAMGRCWKRRLEDTRGEEVASGGRGGRRKKS